MDATSSRVRSGGRLWGRQRVEHGISLARLSEASGVSKGLISLMETGRMIPTSEEYDAITAALARLVEGQGQWHLDQADSEGR